MSDSIELGQIKRKTDIIYYSVFVGEYALANARQFFNDNN